MASTPQKMQVINKKTTDFCKPRNAPPSLSGFFLIAKGTPWGPMGWSPSKGIETFGGFLLEGVIFHTVDRFQPMITWLFSQKFLLLFDESDFALFLIFLLEFFLRSTIFGIFSDIWISRSRATTGTQKLDVLPLRIWMKELDNHDQQRQIGFPTWLIQF